jgi:hypothetical protein
MTVRRIDKAQWCDFCERVSGGLSGKWAEIELASPDVGVQVESRCLPLMGLAYDPHDDAFEVILDGLDHLIFHPLEVYAEFGFSGIESLAIVDGSSWQIVLLRDPVMLPAPGV